MVSLAGAPAKDVASVRSDNATMGALTRHLLGDHGYRRLAFVGEPVGSPDVMERWEAFRTAHVELGDELALGMLGRGLAVPGDIAIPGFDDVPMSAFVHPGMTTVRQPIRELGAVTARLLAAMAANHPVDQDTVLPTELVLRGSCGCP